MARVYQTGWEMGSTEIFDVVQTGSVTTGLSPGSWSTYGYSNNSAVFGQLSLPASYSELYFGVRINRQNVTGARELLRFMEGSTNIHAQLGFDASQNLIVQRNGVTLGTGALLPANGWHYIEGHFIISDTVGVWTVKLDGVTTINLSSQDTRDAGTGVVDRVWFGVTFQDVRFDDFVVNDTTGAQNNSYPGDTKITALIPNAIGDVTQLTRGGTDSGNNWGQVDERPPNDATDYVFHSTVNNYDLYNIPDLSGFGGVQAVMTWLRAQKSDAGAASIAPMLKSGATENQAADQALGTSWAYYKKLYDVDPTDSAAWTVAKVAATQIGVKVR